MEASSAKRVFVTGGTGFLGYRVVRALLEQGASITVLVQPGSEEKLGSLRSRVACAPGDAWNPASLRGRARGHAVVVHLLGGTRPDPARGLTFRQLNYVSARNVAQMAVTDGAPHLLLLSASASPFGVPVGYIESKRDAEAYLRTTGLNWTIVRTPTLYASGERRNLLYLLLSFFGALPVLDLFLAAYRPMAVDIAARGIASLAISADAVQNRLVGARELRRLGRAQERRLAPTLTAQSPDPIDDATAEEPPFGWLP